ncbi:hypothetical protein H6P81_005895 [Aristolochia fimbriata]|uniref:Uncharacterized protein n=1 Tax=Aristolochia fimbriata TaxID=158543 RepID=A0AAV7EWX5_ARIFI|nr:hypothetical protein H6P81_005895 [Aristolochia fimbriata]
MPLKHQSAINRFHIPITRGPPTTNTTLQEGRDRGGSAHKLLYHNNSQTAALDQRKQGEVISKRPQAASMDLLTNACIQSTITTIEAHHHKHPSPQGDQPPE